MSKFRSVEQFTNASFLGRTFISLMLMFSLLVTFTKCTKNKHVQQDTYIRACDTCKYRSMLLSETDSCIHGFVDYTITRYDSCLSQSDFDVITEYVDLGYVNRHTVVHPTTGANQIIHTINTWQCLRKLMLNRPNTQSWNWFAQSNPNIKSNLSNIRELNNGDIEFTLRSTNRYDQGNAPFASCYFVFTIPYQDTLNVTTKPKNRSAMGFIDYPVRIYNIQNDSLIADLPKRSYNYVHPTLGVVRSNFNVSLFNQAYVPLDNYVNTFAGYFSFNTISCYVNISGGSNTSLRGNYGQYPTSGSNVNFFRFN